MVFAELHKRKKNNKKITQSSMQTKYVQQKKFYKTLFLQEETQNIGLKKKTKFYVFNVWVKSC